jgi:imidazolonepropionase
LSALLLAGAAALYDGSSADESAVQAGATLLVEDGVVSFVGPEAAAAARAPVAQRVECNGGVLTPGFVDSHTHAVFGAWRAWEYPLRARGVPYMEIARRGGGIHASVRDVRARTEDELVALGGRRIADMIRLGTTTAEVKSGYGLDVETELRQLRAVRRLQGTCGIDLVPTLLAAHEIPLDHAGRREDFVRLVTHEIIPAAAAEGLAIFCDVFMEPGVFTGGETRTILEAGLRHGLQPKLHADELENSGGAELAAALGAASADHLGAVSDAGIAALAASDTVATLLPATLFFLGRPNRAPARRLLDAGAHVALATDFNPGSAPSPSMPLVLTMACSQMGMSPLEALYAATAGGARALRLEDGRGTLLPGAPADVVLWDAASLDEIPYRFGAPPVAGVWKSGRRLA